MSARRAGLFYCFLFVTLEAFQSVYLGTVFQTVNSFLVGVWVFGISVTGCTLVTAILRPSELRASATAWPIVLALNLFAALAWIAYFLAIQLIEPAVVFTVFSGMVPLGVLFARWLGLPEARSTMQRLEHLGNATILVSILLLSATTILGLSGFVRGGTVAAMAGVALSALSGGFTAFVILYSVRLNEKGVGPLAQFGLRFVLYTLLAFVALQAGLDDKGVAMPSLDLARIVLIGLVVIAFPLYLVQKAVPLLPAAVIAAMTTLGPIMVFLMQLLDGRVAYSSATLAGLAIYVFGAALAIWGTTRSTDSPSHETGG